MKRNIYLKILLFLIFPINGIIGQQLTVEQTLDYISNIENKYTGSTLRGDRVTVEYGIDKDGVFTKKTLYSNNEKSRIVEKISVHVDDLSRDVQYDGDSFIDFKCQNKNCFYVEEDGTKYLNKKPRTSYSNDDLQVYIKQEYQAKKVITAINYLFSLLNERSFKRDIDDPFANSSVVVSQNNTNSNKIPLTESNGTYNIKVRFGHLTKLFVLDSGASEVTISSLLEKELLASGIITKTDYLPKGLYRIADGSIISQNRVQIRKMSIGQFTVHSISASIGNRNSPLLLGKNFLDKFKNWSIDNEQKALELSN